jgi:predicted ribonuclease YlaK
VLLATVLANPWIPRKVRDSLTDRQAEFLSLECREAMFGGAAGGGKSFAVLMAALQYVDNPGYHALILRRTFKQLDKPESAS